MTTNKELLTLYSKVAEKRLDTKVKLLDAAGIVFSHGELEAVESTIYETIFKPRESFLYVPVSTEYNPVATSITYKVKTRTGIAKTQHGSADDRPRADVSLAEFPVVVEEGGASYAYNVDNGDVASLTGFDQARENAEAAAMMIAEWHDKCALNGYDLAGGQTGFANNADVALAQATQTWTSGTTTGAKMFQDIAGSLNKIPEASDGAHKGTDYGMSIAVWNALATTRFDATSDFTVLEKLRSNYPGVNFVQWAALKDQGAGGTNRNIAYEKSATNAVYRATVIYDEDLPVRGNFKFNVDCRGRAAGVTVRYPLSMKYQDITLVGF